MKSNLKKLLKIHNAVLMKLDKSKWKWNRKLSRILDKVDSVIFGMKAKE
jgi:hypothetical protein